MENRDLPLLDTADALARLDGDTDLYRILSDAFLAEGGFSPDTMTAMVAEAVNGSGSAEEAARYVHRMKGAASQLGASRLADHAQNLEDILRGKAAGDAEALADEVARLYRLTACALKNL